MRKYLASGKNRERKYSPQAVQAMCVKLKIDIFENYKNCVHTVNVISWKLKKKNLKKLASKWLQNAMKPSNNNKLTWKYVAHVEDYSLLSCFPGGT